MSAVILCKYASLRNACKNQKLKSCFVTCVTIQITKLSKELFNSGRWAIFLFMFFLSKLLESSAASGCKNVIVQFKELKLF